MLTTRDHEKKYSKLGKNTLWMTIGNFSSKLLTFFLVPLYTTCLSTGEYGTADLLSITVNLLAPFLTLAASEGVLRFTLDREKDNKQVFSISITIVGIGFAILLAGSSLVLSFISLSDYYLFFILYYLTFVLNSVCNQFVKGLEHITVYVISGILSTVSYILKY